MNTTQTISPTTIAVIFTKLIGMEINNRAPLDYDTILETCADSIHGDEHTVEDLETLTDALDTMLQNARALA
jgi:hypothetical protein